tara:strand:- start:1566 stop:1853 length:288 start_codon:yes stop_codon:yes gene_type:complete
MAHQIWGESPNAERNDKIVQMRMKGMTCREIGDEVGISTGRVHQIWKKFQNKKDKILITEPTETVIEEPVVEEEKPSQNIISRYFDIFYRSITGR